MYVARSQGQVGETPFGHEQCCLTQPQRTLPMNIALLFFSTHVYVCAQKTRLAENSVVQSEPHSHNMCCMPQTRFECCCVLFWSFLFSKSPQSCMDVTAIFDTRPTLIPFTHKRDLNPTKLEKKANQSHSCLLDARMMRRLSRFQSK